jgi:hypothetical protein
MRGRSSPTLQTIMAAYAVLWFAVIGPGHQRGLVTLPGSEAAAAPSCCAVGVLEISDRQAPTPSKPDKPTNRSKDCAVCYLNAMLNLPVQVQISVPLLELSALIEPSAPVEVDAITFWRTYRGRAPPISHL